MKDEWWRMMISSCLGVLLSEWQTNGQTDGQTFSIVELLLRLKKQFFLIHFTTCPFFCVYSSVDTELQDKWSLCWLFLQYPTQSSTVVQHPLLIIILDDQQQSAACLCLSRATSCQCLDLSVLITATLTEHKFLDQIFQFNLNNFTGLD